MLTVLLITVVAMTLAGVGGAEDNEAGLLFWLVLFAIGLILLQKLMLGNWRRVEKESDLVTVAERNRP